jgi:cyclopropane-fatty-acyl-phospholipid synthase
MKLFTFEHSPWAYRLDLFLYGISPWVMAIGLMAYNPANSWVWLWALATLGFLAWTLTEYLLHRFILHGLVPFSRWHEEHHQRPGALICMPSAISLGLIFLLVFLPNFWMFGFWSAVAFSLGVLSGYAMYTLVHHATHHSKSKRPWLLQLRFHHATHHAMHKKKVLQACTSVSPIRCGIAFFEPEN